MKCSDTPDNACCNDSPSGAAIESLNRTCYCVSVDKRALHRALDAELDLPGMSQSMLETHPHLFASLPVFIAPKHLEQMARAIEAVETVVATTAYRAAVLNWAPSIASFDPGVPGGFLGYDFHMTVGGPQLIEINTNPGGAFLNAILGRAQAACCAEAASMLTPASDANDIEDALVEVFKTEWRMRRADVPLQAVAIVDETPSQQYLYPEFLLVQKVLARRGIGAVICDPRTLIFRDRRLWHGEQPIAFVYNRLTDFSLQLPEHEALKSAYLAGDVILSPHPRAHALYADKRNLTLLSDAEFLRHAGIADDVVATLLSSVPRTELITPENRSAMWHNRRRLFFKPAAGYGSKATYRGDKVTKRVWEQIAAGTYVAQALVAPSERHLRNATDSTVLKVDVRNYAYAGVVKLVAARLYQGQTTNFRTSGGGFAPVLTNRPQ